MSSWNVYKFRELDEIDIFCKGGITGKDISGWGQAIKGDSSGSNSVPVLAGTTLTFKTPAGTVSFVNGADPFGRLTLLEIKAQAEAAVAGLTVRSYEGKIVFVETTPSTGTKLAASSYGGFAKVIGTVDMRTLTYGGGGSLDGEILVVKHNGGSNLSTTFAAPGNQGAVVTQINANTVAGGITASIDGNNHLVLTSSDSGASASITVNAGGTALPTVGYTAGTYTGAATDTANILLGFDTANDTDGVVMGTPFGSAPTAPYVGFGYSTNDNMHVVWVYQ